jgi:hypothetical protein
LRSSLAAVRQPGLDQHTADLPSVVRRWFYCENPVSGCFGSRLWCGVFRIRTLPLILLMSSVVAAGAEVHISFAALERMLASQIFTDEGRRYVRGSRTEKCNFAWLENRRRAVRMAGC